MIRRDFLTTTAATGLGLPLFASLFAATASANTSIASATTVRDLAMEIDGLKFTDDDADYADWAGTAVRSKSLWTPADAPANEASIKLVRFTKTKLPDGTNLSVPRHLHPDGELTVVLAGSFFQAKTLNPDGSPSTWAEYRKGDVIWMPAGSIHEVAVASDEGTTVLSFKPKNVVYGI